MCETTGYIKYWEYIRDSRKCGDSVGADKWLQKAKKHLSPEYFKLIKRMDREKREKPIKIEAEKIKRDTIKSIKERKEKQKRIEDKRKEDERKNAIASIKERFETDFLSVDDFYREHFSDVLSHDDYEQEKRSFVVEQTRIEKEKQKRAEDKRRKDKIKNAIASIKERFETDFLSVDDFYKEHFSDALSRDDYEREKRLFVAAWFRKNPREINTNQPDDEQITAIASLDENVLLKARAGSGKTSVVVDRTRFLIQHAGVHPDEVMLLAFNKSAAEDITERIRKGCGIIEFNNARTFHGLAYQLVQPQQNLLFDDRYGEMSTAKQSQFIQDIVNDVKNPVFIKDMYRMFRTEMKEMENIGEFLSEDEYFAYRRNHKQLTLKGDSVKSAGEKYIGDFFFEHGIRYEYEKVWYWGKRNYRPDFSFFCNSKNSNIVIEHWGIDENDPNEQVPDYWAKTWREYKDQMNEKRKFWEDKKKTKNILFIETSVVDLRQGRSHFEKILKDMLVDSGVSLKKLGKDELYENLYSIRITRLTKMFLKFIQKAKKQRLSPDDLVAKIKKIDVSDKRTRTFCEMANKIYRKYIRKLNETNSMDFDDLIEKAIEKVDETKGDCEIPTVDKRSVKVNQIKYLMIDEYQDFSPLFFHLIDSIKTHNKNIKLFCVGDDWQAINAFAGSDLRYFNDFDRYIGRSKHLSLLANYRSARSIVDISNQFMNGKGDKSRPTKSQKGEIHKRYTNKTFIEQRSGESYKEKRELHKRFLTKISKENSKTVDEDSGLIVGKSLKACHSIITEERNRHKTVAILSRKRKLSRYYNTLGKFAKKLKETCKDYPIHKDFDKKITVNTTHGFKGREADIVIMLFVNQGQYPLIHPDEELYGVFGSTPQDVLSEEQRLFYVGLTRAKEKLYWLCEAEIESDFLNRIYPHERNQHETIPF